MDRDPSPPRRLGYDDEDEDDYADKGKWTQKPWKAFWKRQDEAYSWVGRYSIAGWETMKPNPYDKLRALFPYLRDPTNNLADFIRAGVVHLYGRPDDATLIRKLYPKGGVAMLRMVGELGGKEDAPMFFEANGTPNGIQVRRQYVLTFMIKEHGAYRLSHWKLSGSMANSAWAFAALSNISGITALLVNGGNKPALDTHVLSQLLSSVAPTGYSRRHRRHREVYSSWSDDDDHDHDHDHEEEEEESSSKRQRDPSTLYDTAPRAPKSGFKPGN